MIPQEVAKMKKIELIMLKLRDFKGIKSLDIHVDGENARIYGDNATGKTTVFDAFLWLLFDKDSQNKKDFAIKTLMLDGTEINNVEHTVEGTFLVDGVPIHLKKIYKEKWTRKRGTATKKFDGHTTEHFIDGVPIGNKKEYDAKVESIVQEDVFKLLTSPAYFNEQVKWQKRRDILLKVCGDISDEDVIASDVALAKLNDVLSGKSIEDMKKIIANKQKKINEELNKIPVRIDEISKMIPEQLVDIDALNTQIISLGNEIDALKSQKHNIRHGTAILEKQKQVQEIAMQLIELKRNFEADSVDEISKLRVRVQEARGNVQIFESKLNHQETMRNSKEAELKRLNEDIQHFEQQREALIEKWHVINKEQFVYEDKIECPTCKQSLPVEEIEKVRQDALTQFNERKTKELEEINNEGQQINKLKQQKINLHDNVNNDLFSVNMTLDKEKVKLETAQQELIKYQEKLQHAESIVPDVSTTETYQSLISQKLTLESEIDVLQVNADEATADIDGAINQLIAQKREIDVKLAQHANIEVSKKRIVELEAEQKRLSAEHENLEANLFLIEAFIKTKVEMLTERINSKFKYARFKLFDEQINGGLNEVCETLYNGVPYGSGLNNAARINVGLDIINTLSTHYGIQAPIFVDNAEGVTHFIDMSTQLIGLVVSEQDKLLRVEMEAS